MRITGAIALSLILVVAACDTGDDAAPETLPDITGEETSPNSSTGATTTTGETPQELPEDLTAAAEQTCETMDGARYADQAAAIAAAAGQTSGDIRAAVASVCPGTLESFETLEGYALRSATVNDNVTVTAICEADVTVRVRNGNPFTIDAGVLVQVGTSTAVTGGSVAVTLDITSGETRELIIDGGEVGTAEGADQCGARATAWEAETGPTATIFDADDEIDDGTTNPLPQTRTDDAVAIVSELIEFELWLLGQPAGALIEEFEDVRSPNFLRLIDDFDERAAGGEHLEFVAGEATDIRVIDQPREDLMLVGWTSQPGEVRFFDSEGNLSGSNVTGARERRGIFLRSHEDRRWRWVHSAFTVLEEGVSLPVDDDSITASR